MNIISKRRSIRNFLPTPLSDQDILEIIQSGTQAPSAKNLQPWKFIVVEGQSKSEMIEVFREGIKQIENNPQLSTESKKYIHEAKHTIDIMDQAPVSIFVLNTLGSKPSNHANMEQFVFNLCNIESISAAIQNMLLTATEKGIGSLWICDIFFAYDQLSKWLNTDKELIAAIALGYPNEAPKARPRKTLNEVVEWRK